MLPEKVKDILKKQHYEIVGEHSAVQVCRWTKKSLRDEGVCYKEKFYGIKSHLCCQMTPSLYCPNSCIHCWRAIEFTTGDNLPGKINSPKDIIDGCILAQRKLLMGFKRGKEKNLSKANMEKWKESQEPMQFAISLSGEPTIYSKIGELIQELNKRGKTSFLVTNGLYPEKLNELKKNKQLPTQLYISVNSPNKKLYNKFHKSSKKNAWEKLNESLEIMSELAPRAYTKEAREPLRGPEKSSKKIFTKGNCRTVFRMNLVKDLNMGFDYIKEYAELIKKANPNFIEVKGYMAVGFARKRLGYERMPTHEDILKFSEELVKELDLKKYNLLDEHIYSRVVVIGEDKKGLKIKGI